MSKSSSRKIFVNLAVRDLTRANRSRSNASQRRRVYDSRS
jgi:hypothetical protein